MYTIVQNTLTVLCAVNWCTDKQYNRLLCCQFLIASLQLQHHAILCIVDEAFTRFLANVWRGNCVHSDCNIKRKGGTYTVYTVRCIYTCILMCSGLLVVFPVLLPVVTTARGAVLPASSLTLPTSLPSSCVAWSTTTRERRCGNPSLPSQTSTTDSLFLLLRLRSKSNSRESACIHVHLASTSAPSLSKLKAKGIHPSCTLCRCCAPLISVLFCKCVNVH